MPTWCLFTSAPSDSPANVCISGKTAESVSLVWDLLDFESQNGIILGYVVNVTVAETGETFQDYSTTNRITLHSLRPFTTYTFAVAAQTSVNDGPFSTTVTSRTAEAG